MRNTVNACPSNGKIIYVVIQMVDSRKNIWVCERAMATEYIERKMQLKIMHDEFFTFYVSVCVWVYIK